MTGAVDIRYAVGQPRGDQPLFLPCPFHGDEGRPNYAVYADGAYCFACHAKETPDAFLARVGCDSTVLPTRAEGRKRRATSSDRAAPDWRSHVEIWRKTLMEGPRRHRLRYLAERGLWLQTIKRLRLGHTGDHFSIPVYTPEGRLAGYRWRGDPRYCDLDPYTGRDAKYLQPKGQPALIFRPRPGEDLPVVVCEGEFDAMLVSQYGYDAVTSTSGAGGLAKDLARLSPKGRILIATDQDEAGDKAAAELQELWPRARRLRWQTGNDISDYLLQTPASTRSHVLWLLTM